MSVDRMLISMLSMSVEAVEMSCAEAVAPQAWDLISDNFLSPLCRMCDLGNPNFSCIHPMPYSK